MELRFPRRDNIQTIVIHPRFRKHPYKQHNYKPSQRDVRLYPRPGGNLHRKRVLITRIVAKLREPQVSRQERQIFTKRLA